MSALSLMTNGMGSPASGTSLLTGGYTTDPSAVPLYRVSNTHPVYIHNREWHERPPTLDTFTTIPDRNETSFRSTGSYSLRSMDVEEAVTIIPMLAAFFSRGKARIRRLATGVQVFLPGYYRFDDGAGSATRKRGNRVFTFDDWERVEELLSDPALTDILGELPVSLSPLSSEWEIHRPLIEDAVRALYE